MLSDTTMPISAFRRLFLLMFAWLTVQLFAATPMMAQGPQDARLDKSALSREVEALLKEHGEGIVVNLWLGGAGNGAWFERNSNQPRPTASAIKSFYLVELFDAYKGKLDQPLPGADAVLREDSHPAISHFSAEQRDEIRHGLSGASVRRVGEVMIGKARASNAVYNAAANLTTAVLGGPEALTTLIRKRDPAFAGVSARRYMLRDRKQPGDNEASATTFAALYQRLASRQLAGIDGMTMDAIRQTLMVINDNTLGTHFTKGGNLTSDPLTEVRAGWWETAKGPLVYVVMTLQPISGPNGRESSPQRLGRTANALTDTLIRAGRSAQLASMEPAIPRPGLPAVDVAH